MSAAVYGYIIEFAVSAALSYAIAQATAPDGQDIEGPKLENLKVGRAAYGSSIARVYGTMRVPGQMVWFKNNQLNHYVYWTDAGGGKGGPDSGSMTNHVYTITGAWIICEGEIDGIRRIWAGNVLIYDASSGAGGNWLSKGKAMYRDLRLYNGDFVQEPDSLIVADRGHSPAYRGLAYAVFDDLEAKKFGNAIPDIKFEVVRNAASDPGGVLATTSGLGDVNAYYPVYANGPVIWWNEWDTERDYYLLTDFDGDVKAAKFPKDQAGDVNIPTTNQGFVNDWPVTGSNYGETVAGGFTLVASRTDELSTTYVDLHSVLPTDEKVISTAFASDDSHVLVITKSGSSVTEDDPAESWYLLSMYDRQAVLVDSGTIDSAVLHKHVKGSSKSAWGSPSPNGFCASCMESDLKHLWFMVGNAVKVYEIDQAGEMAQILSFNVSGFATSYPGIYADYGVASILIESYSVSATRVERFGQEAQDIGIITKDLMMQAGLAEADINVTELTGTTCDGYAILNRETLRSDIEPLMTYAQFDFVESGGKLKAVPRGGSVVAAITEDDLAAHEDSSDRPEKLIERVKLEEELLKEVSVTFIDKARNYNDGQTHATQLNTDSVNKISQKFAISMTRDRATQLANILLDHNWVSRRSFDFKLPPQFSYLEPTDPITVTRDGQTVTMRLTRIEMGANGIMECEGEMYAESVYTSEAVGADITDPTPDAQIYGPSLPYFIDSPLVFGTQTGTLETGYYIGATGLYTSWPGCSGFITRDGGATWQSFGSVSVAAVVGRCNTTLASGETGVLDHANTLTVELLTPGATLESVTRAAMANGANWALVGTTSGWEVIKFQNATLTGTGLAGGNIYELSVLSRGRRGTEHLVGTHGAGETFILMDTRIQRVPMDEDEIGLEYSYAAVTYGEDVQTAIKHDFTNTGVGMRPYSPCQVEGSRDGSSNLTITWKRRTRYGGEWRNSVDITDSDPMTFEVDIMNGSTVVRTISVTAETASYTAAQQTTDFGSTQSSLTVRVYQTNTVYGRGIKAEATI